MTRDMNCAICRQRTLHEWSRKYANLCWCTICKVMKVDRPPASDQNADPLKSL